MLKERVCSGMNGDILLSKEDATYKVIAVGTSSGRCVVDDFLKQIGRENKREFAAARLLIDKLAEFGHGHIENHNRCRRVENDAWELKPPIKGLQVRLYFYSINGVYYICHAQLKKNTKITKTDKQTLLERIASDKGRRNP
jgi:phage-related protein